MILKYFEERGVRVFLYKGDLLVNNGVVVVFVFLGLKKLIF